MISQISYFFCFTKASCRYLIYQCDQFVFFHPLVHFCVNGTAGNSIDLDVAWAQFFGKSTGQSVDAAFGCRVSCLTGSSCNTPYRGNIDRSR